MRPVIAPFVAALLSAGILVSPPAGMAQSQMPKSPQAAPSSDISDQTLDAAAVTMQQMSELQNEYQQKIDAAAPSDKSRLESEGTAAMMKVLADNGLSADEYNSIIAAAQNDPTVRAKLTQRLHTPQQ
jgi:Domain of unknown function (DUF4168)